MPAQVETVTTVEPFDHRQFILRRLHSLTGILPVGLYLIVHLSINSFAVSGIEAYDRVVELLESLPYLILIEIPFIWLPILYHGLYGVYIHATGKANPFQYAYSNNVMYSLQRWSGLITFVFIGWHMWETRLANYLFGVPVDYEMVARILSDPASVVFYVVGLVAVSFHFSNGLRTFLLTWGIVVGDRARIRVGRLCLGIGVLLLVFSLSALWAFMR